MIHSWVKPQNPASEVCLHDEFMNVIIEKEVLLKMRKIPRFLPVIALLFALATLLLAGCSGTTNTTDTGNLAANTTITSSGDSDGYQIKVLMNGNQMASLGLSELRSLPEVTLDISGNNEQGPTLMSVLEMAGVKDFSKVTVSGMLKGRVATGELTLNQSDINNEVIISFNKQGKTKLCGTQIPDSNWIIDVAEIQVE